MKYLNRIHQFGIIVFTAGLFVFSSCQDFLEQPTDAITTVDSVFTNPDNAMYAFYAAYDAALCWNHGMRESSNTNFVTGYPPKGADVAFSNNGNVMPYFWTDEATQELLKGQSSEYFIQGNWGPTGSGGPGQREFPSVAVSNAIRTCNIFLANASKVPMMSTPKWVWNETFRDQVIAEVRTLRAFLHFESFRRFGGIPILDKVATFEPKPGGGLVVTPNGQRQSVKSVIDFIVKECDESLPYLKDSRELSTAETGRVHKGFAYSLKAKTLLYAASPLYNTATPPVSYGDARDSLVCYGNYDVNRWKLAADANQDAIVWAENRGYMLLDDPAFGKRDSYALGKISPRSTSPKNNESIYYLLNTQNLLTGRTYRGGVPIGAFATNYGTIGSMGYKFIKDNFRKTDGTPLNIPDVGTFPELKRLMRQAEPRFHASVWVPGFKYSYLDQTSQMVAAGGNTDTAMFNYHAADATGTLKFATSSAKTILTEQTGFFFPKKWFQINYVQNNTYFVSWTEFGLAELYLSYAEAMNEYQPTNPMILTYLNKIRFRGGIPELTALKSQAEMRAEIQRERSIEEYCTEHRVFDVRRWRIADNVMGGDWMTIYLYENGTGSYTTPLATWTKAQRDANDAKISYKMVKYSTHVWLPKMHFYPWHQDEVNKGILVQNPGW